MQYEQTTARSVDLPWGMGEMTKMKLKMPSKGTTSCLSFSTLAFEGNRERFHRKVAEAARRASFIEDRLTKEKSEANY